MFPSPSTDLSVRVQTVSRVPFVFVFSGVHHRKGTCECKDSGRRRDVGAQRRFESTGRNIWRPPWGTIQNTIPPSKNQEHLTSTVGHDTKHCPTSKNQEDSGDKKYEARTYCTKRGRGPHPATGYGNDVSPSGRDGRVESKPRTHSS